MIDIVGQTDLRTNFWMANPQSVPVEQRTLPVTEAACHIAETLGVEALVEVCGRPWRIDPDAPTAVKDLVAPLALAWSSAEGLVQLQLSSMAADNPHLLGRVLSFAGAVGAAEPALRPTGRRGRGLPFLPARDLPPLRTGTVSPLLPAAAAGTRPHDLQLRGHLRHADDHARRGAVGPVQAVTRWPPV